MITQPAQRKLMTLETEKIGRIEYSADMVFDMPLGLYGFEDEKTFVLYESRNVTPFVWLQSLRSSHLAFLLINPQMIRSEYILKARREDLMGLHIEKEADCRVYVIASIHGGNVQNITLNMQGPLVFNMAQKKAQQIIVENEPLQEPLLLAAVS